MKSGERYGRLCAVRFVRRSSFRKAIWLFLYDCGKEKEMLAGNVKQGKSQSCGCLHREQLEQRNKDTAKHNLSGEKVYWAWCAMKYRTTHVAEYISLGAYQPWVEDLHAFIRDIGYPPDNTRKWSLGRINNNVGYFPENVEWQDDFTQSRNKSIYSSNTTGVAGVTALRNCRGDISGYLARWVVDGKRAFKSFSVSSYPDTAFILAAAWRDKMLRELVKQGEPYTPEHGLPRKIKENHES